MIVTLREGAKIRLAQDGLADVANIDEVVVERSDTEVDVDLPVMARPS